MDDNEHDVCPCTAMSDGVSRRTVLLGAGSAVLATVTDAAADAAPATLPPQPDDLLVQANGLGAGQPIGLGAFATPDTAIQAWAKDPKSGVVRKRSRLNRVLLVRLDPATLDATTKQRSAEGVVAYSDFCTHAGCWIETYHAQDGLILCHCHGSMFDPKHGARVVGGPARAPLAGLPLKVVNAQLVVAGPFDGKLGVPKTA